MSNLVSRSSAVSTYTQAIDLLNGGKAKEAYTLLAGAIGKAKEPPTLWVIALCQALVYAYPCREWAQVAAPIPPKLSHPFHRWLVETYRVVSFWLSSDGASLEAGLARQKILSDIFNTTSIPCKTKEEAEVFHTAIVSANGYNGLIAKLAASPHAQPPQDPATLYMVGDSHVLANHGQMVTWQGKPWRVESHLCVGARLYDVGSLADRMVGTCFRKIVQALPAGSPVAISIGEIDCRDGILAAATKLDTDPTELMFKTFGPGVRQLAEWLKGREVLVLGLPPPSVEWVVVQNGLPTTYPDLVRAANEELKRLTKEQGWGFVDIHTMTVGDRGLRGRGSLDQVHLVPEAFGEGLRDYLK